MARARASYVCQNCGAVSQRWAGKCEACGEWNTIIEEAAALGVGGAAARKGLVGRPFPLESLSGESKPVERIVTGIAELDRVAGGGFVPGSATLIGGEPGIGKSTLLIQACAALARSRRPRRLCLGRGIDGADSAARQPARPLQRAGATGRADFGRGHRRNPRLRRDAEIRHPRFDPDAVERRGRIGARQREPGARARARRSSATRSRAARPLSWLAMSPRTGRSPAPASSSTWSTR